MRVIDLFSGLGGFSEAFVTKGCDVLRIDNNERFKDIPFTVIKDVWDCETEDLRDADIILASPPCRCFSVAADHYHWPKGVPTEETREQIRLVQHTVRIIQAAWPKYWILENPVGRMRDVLGKPAMRTYWCAWGTRYKKPTDLWGRLPPIDWRMPHRWASNLSGGAGNMAEGDPYPRDLAERSLVPYEFSMAVYLAVAGESEQKVLEDGE